MTWQEIRKKYPQTWLLIEAVEAHTTNEKRRVIDRLAVIDEFSGFFDAMQVYKKLHRQTPHREMYVVHTVNDEIRIKEQQWTGVRGVG
jgi:hypothetical protein